MSKFFRTKIICFGFISSFFHPMTWLKIKITSFCTNKKRCCRKQTKKTGQATSQRHQGKQKLEHHRTVLRGSEIFLPPKVVGPSRRRFRRKKTARTEFFFSRQNRASVMKPSTVGDAGADHRRPIGRRFPGQLPHAQRVLEVSRIGPDRQPLARSQSGHHRKWKSGKG